MIDTAIEYEGVKIFLSNHAYERLVERIYGETTRDMLEPTRVLLSGASVGSKPAYANEGRVRADCWLSYDEAGVTFAMPCYAGYSGAHGHYMLVTTVLTPVYKSRKPRPKVSGRKKPKRKPKIGGRGRARPAPSHF